MSVYKCPVCEGYGVVPKGFYPTLTSATVINTHPETCRTCGGKGLFFVADALNNEYDSMVRKLYHIVPKNDGYTYLCKKNNILFLARKDDDIHCDELVFENYAIAEAFIEKYNLNEYTVEAFLRRVDDEKVI